MEVRNSQWLVANLYSFTGRQVMEKPSWPSGLARYGMMRSCVDLSSVEGNVIRVFDEITHRHTELALRRNEVRSSLGGAASDQ